jgi:hypothetical protein
MSKASKAEQMTFAEKNHQAAGHGVMKSMPGIKDTLPDGMKAPKVPNDSNKQLSGKAGSPMAAAVKRLNHEVERNEHVAVTGGHKMHGHSGRIAD